MRTILGCCLLAMSLAVPARAGLFVPWDLSQTDRAGQWTIYNRTTAGAQIGFPLAAGDMNGDGRDDLILTPMNAASGPLRDRTSSGEVVILLGTGVLAGERDLAQLDVAALPPDATVVYGADPHDLFGTEVVAADLDGDGFVDAVVGAEYGDGVGNGRPECGEVVIIWGGPDIAGHVIDLAAPPPGAVTVIAGHDAGDRLGVWVSAADVDGDGVSDAILGADEGDGPDEQRTHAGETTVLYGGPALRGRASIDLADPQTPVTVIYGIDREDHSGATVRGFDVDRDGVGDVLIGAGLNRLSAQQDPTGNLLGHGSGGGDGPNNICDPVGLGCEVGEAYVVYGVRGARPAAIDLAAPPAPITTIYGIKRGDAWGEELFAGDFNGDGFGDVVIGALTAEPSQTRQNAGALALILGGPTLRGATIELASAPANVTFFSGARPSAIAGDTLMLVDLDGDGRSDLVIGSPGDQPQGRVQAGTVFVFFGTPDPLPQSVDLAAIPAGLEFLEIDGVRGGDMLAYSMSLGDVNGDGRTDLVLNAMGADGFHDLLNLAGDAYVLDAVEVARAAGREPVASPTPTTTPGETPTATPTPPPACVGDCNAGGTVSIDELISAVRVALGDAALDSCRAVDADGNGTVSIGELIVAVTRSLTGC